MAKSSIALRFMDRIFPAVVFGVLSVLSLNQIAARWIDPTSELQVLRLLHGTLSIVFSAMVAVLFFIRRSPVGEHPSMRAKAIAIGGSFGFWLMFFQRPTIDDWRVLAVSDVLMCIGVAFTIYSLGTLGRSFSLAPEARKLVTSGPYRWVRNPAYLFEFITVMGVALPLLSLYTVLIFALFAALQFRRIALEEQVLSATFPEYEDYRRSTPALIPRLLPKRLASQPTS